MEKKVTNLKEAISIIKDGDKVAIGGHSLRRHPNGLIYEILRQKPKNLTLQGWNNGIDMDMLIGAGLVKKVETSYVGISQFGLANNFRRAAEKKEIEIVEHSELTAIDRFTAGSIGLTFLPSKSPLGTGLETYNKDFKDIYCPFTGERYAALPAFNPDVAIIHMHTADEYGNIQLDQRRLMENEMDVIIAKSAKKVIVSVEQIVSEEQLYNNSHLTVLPRFFVDKVVEMPYGAHPCSCDTRYDYDLDFISIYYQASKLPEDFLDFLKEYVYGIDKHVEYLEKIGIEHIQKITRRRRVR